MSQLAYLNQVNFIYEDTRKVYTLAPYIFIPQTISGQVASI